MDASFSDQMRVRRKKMRLTQQALSELSGVSRLLINQLENGKARNVRESTIKDVAKALGIADTPRLAITPDSLAAPESPELRERLEQLERELARERAWTEKLWQENQQLKAGQLGKTQASSDTADTPVIPMWRDHEVAA